MQLERIDGGPRSRVFNSAFRSATGLPPLTRYATLQVGDERRVVGYTEASRGLQASLPALSDRPGLRRTVSRRAGRRRARRRPGAGRAPARGTSRSAIPTSSTASGTPRRSSGAFAREFPGVTYDVTIKVEHLLRHAAHAAACCATPAARS